MCNEFDELVDRVQKRADQKVYNGRGTFRPDTDAPLFRDILSAIQTLQSRLAESEARGWQPIETFPGNTGFWISDYESEKPVDERTRHYDDVIVFGPTWRGGWNYSPHF